MGTTTSHAGAGGASVQNSLSPASATTAASVDAVNAGLASVSAAGVADGDKGDITVAGPVWSVDANAITYAKMQDITATDRLLGRSTAGAGDPEEIVCTAAGRALLDDVNADAQRTTLGLGTIATLAAPSAFVQTIFDDVDAAAVRATLGVGAGSGDMVAANNLSDVVSAATARTNLGLGTIATLAAPSAFVQTLLDDADAATARGTLGAGVGNMLAANNLSDVVSAATARTNLGLGTIATLAAPSAFIQTLLDDADAATARTTLGVGTGSGDMVAANNLSDVANAATARTNLGAAPLTIARRDVSITTDTILAGDNGGFVDYTNTGAIAVSITTAFSGRGCQLTWPAGAGTITLTPTGVTLNGSASAVMLSAALGAVSILPIGTNAFRLVGSIGDLVAADITDASANGISLITAANYAAMRSLLSLGTIATLAAPSAFVQTIFDDVDAAAVRTTLGVGTGSGDMVAANNLSDVVSAATARTNLGLGTIATLAAPSAFVQTLLDDADAATARATLGAGVGNMVAANNLSDVVSAATARTNLGLGTIATLAAPSAFVQTLLDDADAATARGTLGAGVGNMLAANNLSDVVSAATARTNLGLGTIATLAAPSAFVQTLLDDADAATARTTLGAGTGSGDMVAANNLSDVASAATARTNLSTAARSQTESGISFFKETISNKDFVIVEKAPHAGTITEAATKCASGTATATFKINGTALGGTANAVSSTQNSQAHSTANAFAAGDRISMTISANSTCVDMAASIKYTRTLA